MNHYYRRCLYSLFGVRIVELLMTGTRLLLT